MKLREFLASPRDASQRIGPYDRIVLTSRVRLARNLQDTPFPGHANKAKRIKTLESILPAIRGLPQMEGCFTEAMDRLTALDKQILVERHLVSREHAAKGVGSAIVLSADEVLGVMINEEDHVRMQAIFPGLKVKEAWEAMDQLDSALEKKLPYAYSSQLGYLTACPTNIGTGIRVSAMLHLPGLVLAEHINQIITSVNKLGLAVRGLYGEGTEALGNVFQVSNQMTLGESEIEIVEKLNKVLLQLIENEENARGKLLEIKPKSLFNHIGRAYGILSNAHSISSKETKNLLSLMRLGVDIGLFSNVKRSGIDELFIITEPAHIQARFKGKKSAEERDMLRADLLRDYLKSVGRPDTARFESRPAGKETKEPGTDRA